VAHAIDLEWVGEAYRRTRKDGAAGVDGCTWADYAANLEANLSALATKIRAGTYRPPPVRRAYIPKTSGGERPIGIPSFEDKIAQRAVAMLLEAIYEQDFMPSSYGFRPGRSAHQALEELQRRPTYWKRCWVIDADIQSFFGAPGQAWRFPAGEIPAPARRRAAPPGIEPWAHGGNDMS